jgi:hypothetical protein
VTYLDDLEQLGIGLGASAVGVNVEGEGLGDTDGVGHLDDAPLGEASRHERLGNPAGSVCRRPVPYEYTYTSASVMQHAQTHACMHAVLALTCHDTL